MTRCGEEQLNTSLAAMPPGQAIGRALSCLYLALLDQSPGSIAAASLLHTCKVVATNCNGMKT